MAKFKFSRCPRRRRIKFFQSSPRYLNNNRTAFYESGKARRWSLEDPQSSDRKILTFTNGHYGIYFSLFNHELRKKEECYRADAKPGILLVLPTIKTEETMPEFHISKANQKIHNDINEIKSTLSGIGAQSSFKAFIPSRNLSTTTKTFYSQKSKLELPRNSAKKTKGDGIDKDRVAVGERNLPEEDAECFEESFVRTQTSAIVQTFQNHKNSSELNVIFPLYQSLKRNDLVLPSIKEYNIVMKSIVSRSLDNEHNLNAIEQKLTCLMTVYEDVLVACAKSRDYAPDLETYNILLSAMFENINKAINLTSEPLITHHAFQNIIKKCHEFMLVGIRLLLSIRNFHALALDEFFPNVLRCINYFPTCINIELANLLILLKDSKVGIPAFYSQMILASKHISKPHLLNMSKKESYDFISTLYANYKESVSKDDSLKHNEYEVYCALVESLILNENLPVATKFVDQIILSFKDDCQSGDARPEQVKDVSCLLSRYIDTMIISGKQEDLKRALNLVSKFRRLNYLPELGVNTHGNLLKAQINHFISQEIEKQSNAENGESPQKLQNCIYESILEHYNFIAIRKDFQENITPMRSSANGYFSISCREALLSLALDIGDHPTVARLLKEILLKNDIIRDWNISKKLCQYLLNGVLAHKNQYYMNVMWNFAEQQASRLKDDPHELHNFLSEHADFLLHETPSTLEKVLNLLMVHDAIKYFSIETCNGYGVITLMNFMMERVNQVTSSHEALKMLQYQALLIQELEGTHNHYVELCAPMFDLKQALIQSFNEYLTKISADTLISEDINIARVMVGDQNIIDEPKRQIQNSDFKVDVSPQLIVNFDLGVRMFCNYFKDGYSFSAETTNAIISREFVATYLEKENPIKVRDFLSRLFSTESDNACAYFESQIVSLINLGNERVNVKILDCLMGDGYEHLLKLRKVLESIAKFASVTENKQYLKTLHDNFLKLKSLCPDKKWVTIYLSKLILAEKYSQALDLINGDFAYFVGSLNPETRLDEEVLFNVFTALLRNEDFEKVNAIFKEKFSGAEGNRLLLRSEKLLSCFFDYYNAAGSFGTILQQFSALPDKSPILRQKIQFARYLAHLEGIEVQFPPTNPDTAEDLVMELINESNILRMGEVYKRKQYLVGNKDEFFRELVETLNKAARHSKDSNLFKIQSKFETMIKLCKAIGLKGLSCTTLSSIIKLLTATKSTDLLHILFTKFNNNNTLMWNMNFFFLRIEIKTPKEASTILQSFKEALIEVGDNINLAVIEQMEERGVNTGGT